jgi:hypothetical protein
VDAGVYAAAKALGRSTRSINRIAKQHGIEFSTNTEATRQRRRADRDALAAKISELAGTRSQSQICEALGITRAILREIAEIHYIDINSRKRA